MDATSQKVCSYKMLLFVKSKMTLNARINVLMYFYVRSLLYSFRQGAIAPLAFPLNPPLIHIHIVPLI